MIHEATGTNSRWTGRGRDGTLHAPHFRPRPLKEQVIVLTGATSGIGLVTARMLSRRGARLVLAARNAPALDTLAQELSARGAPAIAAPADVGDREQVGRLAQRAVEEFGRIDTWINDASVSIYGRVSEIDIEEHRRVFETNYWGYVYGCLEAIRHMKDHGGQIISVLSVLSDRAIPMQGPYCATKHALKAIHDSMRMELKKQGVPIEVSVIKPSAVDTPYKDHARNYLPVAPKNPPPVYSPDTVARAIVHCAEHPRREVTIGLGGAMVSLIGRNFLGLTDWVMNRTMHALQRTHEPPRPRDEHALFEPRGKVLRERGEYPHYVHETSLYTQSTLHPLAVASVVGGAAAAMALAATLGARRGRRGRAPAVAGGVGGLGLAAAAWMLATSRRHGREQPSIAGKLREVRGGYF